MARLRGAWSALVLASAGLVACVAVGCSGDADDDPTAAPGSADSGGGREGGTAATVDGGSTSSATVDGGGGGDAALGPEESGEATYYDPTGNSACGVKGTASSEYAAMNATQYRKEDCGRCVLVTGPKGSVVVPVVDKCPGCKKGDLDLGTKAFAKIAPLSAGRVKITWHFVACP